MELLTKENETKENFTDLLRDEMNAFCRSLLENVPLFYGAKQGVITRRELGQYLTNLKFLLSNTDACISLAMNRSRELGWTDLAEFYQEKLHEEEGHEEWARQDLKTIRMPMAGEPAPSRHLVEMMQFIRASIIANPTSYLGYVLLTEFVTVNVGSVWLADLDAHCGIQPASLSSVSNHVELDKHHIMDDFKIISSFVRTGSAQRSIERVMLQSMRHFEAFCREIKVPVPS